MFWFSLDSEYIINMHLHSLLFNVRSQAMVNGKVVNFGPLGYEQPTNFLLE